VTLERFVRDRRPSWDELAELTRRAGRRPRRLSPSDVIRLGTLYRGAAADLALARRLFAGDPIVARLEELVARSRALVYSRTPARSSLRRFLLHGYWRLVAERRVALLVAAILLFAPASLAAAWALDDPAAATGLVPGEFRDVTESERPWSDLPAGEQAAFSSYVLTNNVRVAAFAFAGGITLGFVTALVLLFNGTLLGAVAGLMVEAGNGDGFVELVTAHGVLELSCIVVAGAAGLSLGWSIVSPGRRTRTASLVREARAAVGLVLGTAPWLGVAAIVEGFRRELGDAGLPAVVAVGFALGALYWGLVVVLGPAARAPEP
jgi:uncharacterized membrane protein SpoIIM required for sporulation